MILKILLSLLSSALALEKCINGPKNGIIQEPNRIVAQAGETAVITCSVTDKVGTFSIKLRKRFTEILYMNKDDQCTVEKPYEGRFTCSGKVIKFTVHMRNLTEEDSDFYLCDGKASPVKEIYGSGTFIYVEKTLVEGKEKQASKAPSYLPYIISGCVLIMICGFVIVIFKYRTSKEKKNLAQNTYVDMTQTIRRNTIGNSSIYNKPLKTAPAY